MTPGSDVGEIGQDGHAVRPPRGCGSGRARRRRARRERPAPRRPAARRARARPGRDVGAEQQDRSQQRRVRQDPPVVGPAQHPGDVRDDQADEHDRAAGRGGRAAQDRDGHEHHDAGASHALAEREGQVVTQGEAVERASGAERDGQPEQEERRGLPEHREVASGERPDLPEPQLVEGADVGHHDGRGDRGQDRGDGGTGEGQLDRGGAFAAEGRDAVDRDGRGTGAQEREPDVDADRLRAEHHDAEHDEGGRAGVDAHDARVGQRVARHALQDRAADAQGSPDQQPDQRPGHAQLADHRLGSDRRVVVGERLPDLGQSHAAGPQRDAEEADHEQDPQQGDQSRRQQRPRAVLRALVDRAPGADGDAHVPFSVPCAT